MIGLTGCAELSEQATTLEYDPADGVSAKVGSVGLSDVLLVTTEDSTGKAKLAGLATNQTGRDVEITVGAGAEGGKKFTVPARSAVRLDGKKNGDSDATIKPVTLDDVKDKAGETTTLAFTSAASGQVQVTVPLLLNQYPYGTASVTHPTGEAGEGGGH